MKRLLLILLIALGTGACKGSKKKKAPVFIVNKALPKSEVSSAQAGDVILSASRLEKRGDRNRVVYSYWRFMGAIAGTVKMQYEEHYQRVKQKPDLVDAKDFKVDGAIELDDYRLLVFKLKTKSITYQVISAQQK